MERKKILRHAGIVIAGGALLMALAVYSRAKEGEADSQPGPALAAPSRNAEQAAPVAAGEKKQADQYWIGVRCVAPIPEVVLAHVELPADGGVYVVDVVPDGPAAKGGLARHDIILSAAGGPLQKVSDLVAAVERSQGKPLALEILRQGKRQAIEVAPQTRPAEFASKGELDIPPGSRWHKLGEWFDENLPGMDGRPPLRMRFMHPGIILPPQAKNRPPLPEGMSITITRKDDKPAQIVVKRNNETWELSEDDLDKLPADVRPHVAEMLGGAAPDVRPRVLAPGELSEAFQARMQEQLEAMQRQMEQVRKMADELRRERLLFDRQRGADSKGEQEAEPKTQ